MDYDAALRGFLPVISILPALFCLLCTVGQGPRFEVLVGSGEVRAELVDEVRRCVGVGSEELLPAFPGLEPLPFTVFVHASEDEMPPALSSLRHPGAPGFALLGRHQVHLVIRDIKRTGASLQSVIKHELVHELLDQHVAPEGDRLPRWFHEGLAQHLAGDTYLGAREEELVWRVGIQRLLSFSDLRAGFPSGEDELRVAYGQSYSYVSWLVRRFGLDEVVAMAADTDARTTFDQAMVWHTGKSTVELYDAWTEYLQYGSGAWWRVLLDQCFNALMILALPALAVAWWRRRRRGQVIAARMQQREVMFPHEFDLEREEAESGDEAAEKPGRDGDPN